jgi:lipoprotein
MKLTFSKTLLATAVMLGLTACSSGGGGNGSNEATTTPKNNNQVTIPNNQGTSTSNNTPSSNQQNANKPEESINIPVVNNQTENTLEDGIWERLPAIPTVEKSTITGSGADLKGKATYFNTMATENFLVNGKSGDFVSRRDKNEYIIFNADFDNKKISGTSAFSLVKNKEKVGQIQIDFEETTLYKTSQTVLRFAGDATAKFQTIDSKFALSGIYNGIIWDSGDKLHLSYELNAPKEKGTVISDNFDINKQ